MDDLDRKDEDKGEKVSRAVGRPTNQQRIDQVLEEAKLKATADQIRQREIDVERAKALIEEGLGKVVTLVGNTTASVKGQEHWEATEEETRKMGEASALWLKYRMGLEAEGDTVFDFALGVTFTVIYAPKAVEHFKKARKKKSGGDDRNDSRNEGGGEVNTSPRTNRDVPTLVGGGPAPGT